MGDGCEMGGSRKNSPPIVFDSRSEMMQQPTPPNVGSRGQATHVCGSRGLQFRAALVASVHGSR